MGVNYSLMVYAPNFILFARPITFYPVVSSPSSNPFYTRGIYHDGELPVTLEDGSVFIDQETSIDILEADFDYAGMPQPQQLDRVYVPQDGPGGMKEEDMFEVTSVSRNGGGETKLVLRKYLVASLP